MVFKKEIDAVNAKSQKIIRDLSALVDKLEPLDYFNKILLPYDKVTIFLAMQIA